MNKKNLTYLFFLLLATAFYSCEAKSSAQSKPVKSEISSKKISISEDSASTIREDIKTENPVPKSSKLKKYAYPNMSFCGGELYGYYDKNKLVKIESTYSGEAGYVEENVDFENGKVKQILYREYFGDQDKYWKKYPKDEYFDWSKMTFTDTLYILEFGETNRFKKTSNGKLITKDVDQKLIDQLLECVEKMKGELESEKKLVKE